jgi:hypothetical protein
MLAVATVALLRVAGRTAEVISLAGRVDVDAFDPRERAYLTMGLASAYSHQGDFAQAYDVVDDVVEFARIAKLPGLAVSALGNQLIASLASGNETGDLRLRLMDAAEAMDQPDFSSFAEGMLGSLDLIEGRFGEATRHLSRSMRLDSSRATMAQGYAIVAALLAGDDAAAESSARASLTVVPPATPLALAGYAWNPLRSLALWHAWTGDLDEARRVESRALACQHSKPMPLADADHLVTLAAIAFFDDDAERAALLLGVGRRAMSPYRSWRGHDAGPLYLHFRQRCIEALGRERADRFREEGLARDPDEMLAEARAEFAAG